jgi:hypothetical protein
MDFLYPVTIIQDRYTGTYSGGRWLAFNLDPVDLPDGPFSDDVTCFNFWTETQMVIGIGDTPDEALESLKSKL